MFENKTNKQHQQHWMGFMQIFHKSFFYKQICLCLFPPCKKTFSQLAKVEKLGASISQLLSKTWYEIDLSLSLFRIRSLSKDLQMSQLFRWYILWPFKHVCEYVLWPVERVCSDVMCPVDISGLACFHPIPPTPICPYYSPSPQHPPN